MKGEIKLGCPSHTRKVSRLLIR